MRIFRLHRGHRRADDYAGSLIQPSRWNPPGTPMLYCTTALSLACLEVLVHLSPDQIPLDYVFSAAELSEHPEKASFYGKLGDGDATRAFGRQWATSRTSLAVLVPSVIIPIERNVLLNPTHSSFDAVEWSAPEPFGFDRRLLRSSSSVA
jgi:RES domain-containing protein